MIFFSAPFRTGREADYVRQVLDSALWHGDGSFTERVTGMLSARMSGRPTLLTTSGTHALELAVLLTDVGPGDEVICPAFTFSSTAAAIALRGATPVLVDVDPMTLNLDVNAVAAALTDRTRAVMVVHYGGVGAPMEDLLELSARRDLVVIEDNAHGFGGFRNGRPLGTFGLFAAQSWHDTKNVTSGEGGALVVNDPAYLDRAEILREKGTNRSQFLRGDVDKYTWVDHGSSYLPSEILAAVLLAQLEQFEEIQARRQSVWSGYADHLPDWAERSGVRLMHVPDGCEHPAHLFYLLMPSPRDQAGLIAHLRARNIIAAFHYQALDASPAGERLCRVPAPCEVSRHASTHLVRLPLHAGMDQNDIEQVIDAVRSYRCDELG